MKSIRPGPGLLIFTAALVLRAGWVLYRWSHDGPTLAYPDEDLHWRIARNLLQGGEFVTNDGRYAARMPLYPLFLALFAWIGDTGVLVVRLVQALLGAATAWIAYRFARTAFDARVALAVGILVCFDLYAIFFANLLLTEVPFTLIAVGLVACAWRVVESGGGGVRWGTIGVALLGAAAIMTRPSALGWIVLLWVVLWLLDSSRARAKRRLALNAGVLVVVMLPWGVRNHAALGSFAWLSTNGGVTLYDAQGPQARGESDQAFLQTVPELRGVADEVERDRILRWLAIDQMVDDPGRALRLAWVKFRRTWSLTPNVADYSGGPVALASAAFMLVVLTGAAAGLVRTRRKWRLHLLIWLPVLYFTLLHCVFVGSLRYRVPIMPFVELVAAAAIVCAKPPARRDAL